MDEVIKLLSDILGNDLDKDGDLVLYGDDDTDNNEWVNRLRSALVKAQKRMYDDKGRYTNGGHYLDLEAGKVIRALMDKWIEQGYNIRDIAHVLHLVILDHECMCLIDWGQKQYKKRLEEEKEELKCTCPGKETKVYQGDGWSCPKHGMMGKGPDEG